jgi:microcystin-dependent protein
MKRFPRILLLVLCGAAGLLFVRGVRTVAASPPLPDLLFSTDILLRRSGHTRLVIHSQTGTPTGNAAMFEIRTGGGAGTSRFKIDTEGDATVTGTFTLASGTLSTTATRINTALDGVTSVTAAKMDDLTDGGTSSAHNHGGTSPFDAGTIVMWSGTLATVPSGWKLCDGLNSTPDLRDRFIMGTSGSGEDPGSTGGQDTVTLALANLPAHSHTGSLGTGGSSHNHTLNSISSDFNHTHSLNTQAVSMAQNLADGYSDDIADSRSSVTTGSGGAHSHSTLSVGNEGAHTHSVTGGLWGSGGSYDNRPAYYKLAFIMKE